MAKGSKKTKTTQTGRNTVTQSISFERRLYDLMEKERPQLDFRGAEIHRALEFYYAFKGKLPIGFQLLDARNVADAQRAAKLLEAAGR